MGGPRAKNPNRTAKGTFAKGQSGNPGGRPRGIVARIREATDDGELMLKHFIDVVKGDITQQVPTADGIVEIGPSVKDRTDCAKWLDVRLHGKPLERVQLTEQEARIKKYEAMSREELAAALKEALSTKEE